MRKIYKILLMCLVVTFFTKAYGQDDEKEIFTFGSTTYVKFAVNDLAPEVDGTTFTNDRGADHTVHYFSYGGTVWQLKDGVFDDGKLISGKYDPSIVPVLRIENEEEQYNSKVVLEWEPVTDAVAYFVFREGVESAEEKKLPIAKVTGATTTYEDSNLDFNTAPIYTIRALIQSGNGWKLSNKSNGVNAGTSDLIYNAMAQNEYVIDHEVGLTIDMLQGLEHKSFNMTIAEGTEAFHTKVYSLHDFTSPSLDVLEKKMVLTGGLDVNSGTINEGTYVEIQQEYLDEIENDWTFELYVKKENDMPAQNKRMLISGSGFELVMTEENSTSTQLALYENGSEVVRSMYAMPTASWIHLAVVKTGNKIDLYQGGRLSFSHMMTSDPGKVNFIGKGTSSVGYPEKLSLAYARLWNTTRSARQIAIDQLNLYEIDDYPAYLLDQWKFDQLGVDPVPGLLDDYAPHYSVGLDLQNSGQSYSIFWSDVFSIASYSVTKYFRQFVEPATTHNYEVSLHEVGNGNLLISKNTAIASATLPNPVISTINTPAINRVIYQTDAAAEQTRVSRRNIATGEEINFTPLAGQESNFWTFDGTNCVYNVPKNGQNFFLKYPGGNGYDGQDYSFVLRFRQTQTNGEVQYLINSWKYTHEVLNLYITPDNELQLRMGFDQYFNLGEVTTGAWHEVLLTYNDLSDPDSSDGTFKIYFDRQLAATREFVNVTYRAGLYVQAIGANTLKPNIADPDRPHDNHISQIKEEFIGEIAYFGGIEKFYSTEEITAANNDLPGQYDGWKMYHLFEDAYDMSNAQTITGGETYEYKFTPYYENTEYEASAQTHQINTTDLSLTTAVVKADTVSLNWTESTVSSQFATDTVYVLRDGEKIARVVGASTYDDGNPAPGTNHSYGVAPVVNGEFAFSQYVDGGIAANGSIAGWFLSKKSNFVLENVTVDAIATINDQKHTLNLTSDQINGSFAASGVYYDREAAYRFDHPAKEGLFTLNEEKAQLQNMFVSCDSVVAQQSVDEDVFSNFQNAADLGVYNINKFSWSIADFWPENQTVYTNIYRNEELIGIVVSNSDDANVEFTDLDGNSGEQYAYKLRSYCHSCITAGVTAYSDTLMAMTYPDMRGFVEFTVTGTEGNDPKARLDFSYIATEVDGFDVYRQAENSDESVKITTMSIHEEQLPQPLIHLTMEGDVIDMSGNNLQSQLLKNPTFETNALEGSSSIRFGGDSYSGGVDLDLGRSVLNSAFTEKTIAFWIYPESPNYNGGKMLYEEGTEGAGLGIRIEPNSGKLEFAIDFYGSYKKVVSSESLFKDKWYHVAAVYDNGIMRFYLNGMLQGSVDTQFSNVEIPGYGEGEANAAGLAAALWRPNLFPGGYNHYYAGLMDDFYVFDEAFSITQVQTLSKIYSSFDLTGIPGTNYKYWVEARTGDNKVKSNEVLSFTYPLDPTALSISVTNMTTDVVGTLVKLSRPDLNPDLDNYDGYALIADGEVVQTIKLNEPSYSNQSENTYYMKHYGDTLSRIVSYSYAKYKQNEEGLFIFDELPVTNASNEGFGINTAVADKTAVATTGPGFLKVNWDLSAPSTWQEGALEFRVAMDKAGTSIELDPHIRSWAGPIITDGTTLHIKDYDHSNALIATSNSFDLAADNNAGIDGFQEIKNLKASQDLHEGVFLTWEYPEFANAEFEIYRDGTRLTTVSTGIYHYFDKDVANINANEMYAYQVQAVYDEDDTDEWYSARSTVAGMRRVKFVVEGHVFDGDGKGLANVGVNIKNVWTRTDNAGYYKLDKLYFQDAETVNLAFNTYDPTESSDIRQSVALVLSEATPRTTQNVVLTNNSFDFIDNFEVAGAVALTAYPNEEDFSVALKIQLSSNNYDGVELVRTAKLIADLSSYEDLEFTDFNGESGANYDYFAKPYIIRPNGERIYGYHAAVNQTYPLLLPPEYLATESADGFVQFTMADKNQNRSHRITRMDENELAEIFVADVAGNSNNYIDKTGIALAPYFYKVYSVLENEENTIISTNYSDIKAVFPLPKDVDAFKGTPNMATNSVTLTWDIPAGADLTRLNLFKNEKEVTLDEELPSMYVDSIGVPGVINTYRIETFREGSDIAGSAGQSAAVRYPDLPAVADLTFSIGNGTYLIRKAGTNYFLNTDMEGNVGNSATYVNDDYAKWNFKNLGNGEYEIWNVNFNQRLEPKDGGSSHGTKVVLSSNEDDEDYGRWIAVSVGNNFQLKSKANPNVALDISPGNSTHVHLWIQSTANSNQIFELVPAKMIETVAWNYDVKSVDGFYMTVTQDITSDVVVSSEIIEAVPGNTYYQYEFEGGTSGVSYGYQIIPFTTREDNEYVADPYDESNDFTLLPAPLIELGESGDDYQIVTWDYNFYNFKEWKLSFNGTDYTLDPGERSFLLKNTTGNSINNKTVTLVAVIDQTAYADGTNSEPGISTAFSIGEKASIAIVASEDQNGKIIVDLSSQNTGDITLYRDDIKVATFTSPGASEQYTDTNINPGEVYLYKVVQGNNSSADEGKGLGMDGQIQGGVKTTSGTGVAGVKLKLTGYFDGRYITSTTETWTDGTYVFNDLPYSSDDVNRTIYSIEPITPDRVFGPEHVEVALSKSFNTGGAEVIYDKSSFIVNGTLHYAWANAPVPALQVSLYGFDANGNDEFLQEYDTPNSSYTFAQNIDSRYDYYVVKVNEDVHKDGDDSKYYYSYFEKDGNDGSIISEPIYTANLSRGTEVNRSFEDALTVTTTFSVRGVMGSLGDYRWKIRLQDDSGKIDTLLVTDKTGYLTTELPPLNYSAKVVAVDRPSNTSEAILAYFKAEKVLLAHQDSLKVYTERNNPKNEILTTEGVFVREADFVFHKVPEIIHTGLVSNKYLIAECESNDDLYKIPVLEKDEDLVTMNFSVKENFDGVEGEVTDGHLLVVNPTTGENAKLVYTSENGGWVSAETGFFYSFTPTNVNVVDPYTQLIEFHYFNENGRYMATEVQKVIVTGIRNLGDSDFVTDPGEFQYPLFVLRDPQGDASKSTIEAGSSVKYSYKSKMGFTGKTSGAFDKSFKLGPLNLANTFKLSLDAGSSFDNSYNFSLDFKESLSTTASAQFDVDRKAYQLGREQDIIVGLGVNLTFSGARKTKQEGCAIDESMIIAVDLADINSTWSYTVSEIERNIDYYHSVINDEDVLLTNTNEDDDTDLKVEFQTIADNWKNILKWHDLYNRAPVNTCNIAIELKDEYDGQKITWVEDEEGRRLPHFLESEFWEDPSRTDFSDFIDAQNLDDELKDIANFCRSDIFKEDANGKLYTNLSFSEEDAVLKYPNLEMPSKWEQQNFEDYEEVADKFRKVWIAMEVYSLHKRSDVLNYEGAFTNQGDYDVLLSLDSLDGFDLAEDRSFSAGAAYTQTITSSKSFGETIAENLKSSFGITTKFGNKVTSEEIFFGSIIGVGVAGTISKAPVASVKVGLTTTAEFASAFDFSQTSTAGESLKISYTLNDNDHGDHINTWVLHDPTGQKSNMTPDFIATGGKTSCPYEEGTSPRDIPQIKAIDEEGVEYPTNYFGLRPFLGSYPLPVQITNLAPYNIETRKWGIMQGAHGNMEGLKMVFGQEIIGEASSKRFYVEGDQPQYHRLGFGSYGSGLGYDFENVHLIVGPQCEVANGWVHPLTTDTLTLNVHFRRPLAPVGFEQEDNWFITQNVPSWTFGIQNYRLDIRQSEFKEIWLEYRRKDSDNYSWTEMTDEAGESVLSKEYLQKYYDEYKHIYPYEYYPFAWTPDSTILDGDYMIRAVIIHPDGEVGYSPSFPAGMIDRRAPRVVNLPAPTDNILSRGDLIGVSMDETLNCDYFYSHPELTNLTVYELDGTEYRTLKFHSDPEISEYELRCSGSGIDIIIDDEILAEVDGKDLEFTISGLKDLTGNVADDVTWEFRSDHFKYPVSPIKLYDPSVVLVNQSSSDQIPFVMAAMQLYNNFSVLDSVELQYRKVGTDTYVAYDRLTIDQMRDGYDLYSPDHSKKPQDTIMVAANEIPDGQYNFRLVAWGEGRLRTSNVINGTFDRINPHVMNVSPESRVVDWGDQIRITYSEKMYDRDGLSFITEIVHNDGSVTDFTDRIKGFINSNWTGFTLNDINDALLHAAFGDTLKITLNGVKDYYGNPLLDNVISFAIGNFAPNVSGVVLHDPQAWVMNGEESNQSVTFMVGDYDLYGTKGKELDSLKLVYNLEGTGRFVEIASYRLSELQTIYENGGNLQYTEPTVNITWDISTETSLADGNYQVYAVAYGDNGKPNYSNGSTGIIDQSAPVYTGASTPADGLVEATDYFMEFKFTEPVNPETGTITVGELVSGVPVAINESLYDLYVSGNSLQIMPSESFRVIYAGETVEVLVNGIEDLHGNALVDEFWQSFTMDANYTPSASSRQFTEIAAERIETGEVAVSWTSYESFDETMLERSRDGINFTEIARYNGDIDSHLDEVNFSKLVFYRLKQTEDTALFYSKTIAVETDNLIPLLVTHTYPMPFDGKDFKLSVMTNNLEDDVEFQIMNTTGMVIASQSISAEKLNNLNVKIKFDEPLKPGIYHMQMVQGKKRSYQKLLVVN